MKKSSSLVRGRYSAEKCEELAFSDDWASRKRAAKYVECPEHALLKLADDSNVDVRRALAKRKRSYRSVWERLVEDSHRSVVIEAVMNPSCPPDLLDKFALSDEVFLVTRLASNPSTSAETIKKILNRASPRSAGNAWEFVRVTAAKHPNLPVEYLLKECEGYSQDIKHVFASNPSFPASKMRQLVRQEKNIHGKILNPSLYLVNIAENVKCPTNLLEEIADAISPAANSRKRMNTFMTHRNIVMNWKASDEVIRKIYVMYGSSISLYLFKNINRPMDVLEAVASNPDEALHWRQAAIEELSVQPKYEGYPREWVEANYLS